MLSSEQRKQICRDAARWGGAGVVVAVVLELVARWALPDHADDLAGWFITGVMLVWLGAVLGITMERRNQAKSASNPDRRAR